LIWVFTRAGGRDVRIEESAGGGKQKGLVVPKGIQNHGDKRRPRYKVMPLVRVLPYRSFIN
jgi:hypothetical protein